jgi:ssDNA-binding Zn-finger/Zn-ribbon topoisomerase 1
VPGYATYRRCPNCRHVHQAADLRRASGPVHAPGQLQRRRCPACGHAGPLAAFRIVPRPESDQRETS